MVKRISLDEILISSSLYNQWVEAAKQTVTKLIAQGVEIESIPNEQAEIDEAGNLTIFVEMNGQRIASKRFPRSYWQYRMPNN